MIRSLNMLSSSLQHTMSNNPILCPIMLKHVTLCKLMQQQRWRNRVRKKSEITKISSMSGAIYIYPVVLSTVLSMTICSQRTAEEYQWKGCRRWKALMESCFRRHQDGFLQSRCRRPCQSNCITLVKPKIYSHGL